MEKTNRPIPPVTENMVLAMKQGLQNSADLMVKSAGSGMTLLYMHTLIEKLMLHQDILSRIKDESFSSIDAIMGQIRVADIQKSQNLDEVITAVLAGNVIVHLNGDSSVLLVNIPSDEKRALSKSENESQVVGSQIAFNESLSTNIQLIRRYLADPNLCQEMFHIGTRTHTAVSMLYIKDIALEEYVNNLRERLTSIKIDGIIDSAVLSQLIEDSSLSLFPQMTLTERPDLVSHWLLNGKIAVLVDGSTLAICCPHSFIEFFHTMEDINVRWQIATFLRLLRMTGVFMSIFFTAVYVAVLTYHYEIIPQALLIPLSESRARVPFPPLFEAFLLEFMIEFLREAGSRMPTKVGQTIGIVGGIVIGTAAVDAGFTSNILIIIVALGALGSFITPSYTMGNVIRILRFPLILLAGFWGLYGIMFGFCLILLHLLRQTTLGAPFMAPFYPPRFSDWKTNVIRLPFTYTFNRPIELRPKNPDKYNPDKAKKQK
ncbi:spore germination protein [Bacillus sp. FJAT-29814]|uniref:spore germination protein n=1 Tax=Bacillus sp. FJAT-29814 TaxID=1729688 RepID=UPI000A810DB0|nr:spore germination protein [Bacillus sp. FJAT-29814]